MLPSWLVRFMVPDRRCSQPLDRMSRWQRTQPSYVAPRPVASPAWQPAGAGWAERFCAARLRECARFNGRADSLSRQENDAEDAQKDCSNYLRAIRLLTQHETRVVLAVSVEEVIRQSSCPHRSDRVRSSGMVIAVLRIHLGLVGDGAYGAQRRQHWRGRLARSQSLRQHGL